MWINDFYRFFHGKFENFRCLQLPDFQNILRTMFIFSATCRKIQTAAIRERYLLYRTEHNMPSNTRLLCSKFGACDIDVQTFKIGALQLWSRIWDRLESESGVERSSWRPSPFGQGCTLNTPAELSEICIVPQSLPLLHTLVKGSRMNASVEEVTGSRC